MTACFTPRPTSSSWPGSGASGDTVAGRIAHGPPGLSFGLLLIGFGTFNLVEGVVDHHILQVHHVREDSANQLAWDLGFLAWGVVMLAGGWWLYRRHRVAS